MKRHTVDSIMTRDVVAVRPDVSFKDIATLLADHDISAVPVTDFQDRIIGVVSEADLLAQLRTPPRRRMRRPWRQRRPQAVKTIVTDLMTTPAITVSPNTAIIDAVRLLSARNIKRVPVVDAEGRLLGIVSRHDLVRMFVRPDQEIETEILEDVLPHALCVDPRGIGVSVRDGVVTLAGQLERRSMVPIATSLCRYVDGVVDVVNNLTYDLDDSTVGDGMVAQNVGVLHGGTLP
ncbi:MAG TPA: CBS domain-containing protein [Pseudonocardiaceae bacterium]|nr:CBS domain-containing protein [Pseudonocardiaceae bacterium]